MSSKTYESNCTIKQLTIDEATAFLEQVIDIIDSLEAHQEFFTDYVNGDNDIDEFIENLETAEISDVKYLQMFDDYSSSLNAKINCYFQDTFAELQSYLQIIHRYTYLGVEPTVDVAAKVQKRGYKIISTLSTIIFYEFSMDAYTATVNSNDTVICNIIDLYARSLSITVDDVVARVETWKNNYPIKLTLFDEYPEYYEPFIAAMGPYLIEIDEEKLTLEHVTGLINGKYSVDTIIQQCVTSTDVNNSDSSSEKVTPMTSFN